MMPRAPTRFIPTPVAETKAGLRSSQASVSKEFSNLSMNVAKQIAADFNEKIIGGSGAGASAKSAYDVAKAYKLWSKKTMFQAVALSFKENIDRTSAIMSKAVKDLAPAAVQILRIRPNQVVQGAMQQQQGQEQEKVLG